MWSFYAHFYNISSISSGNLTRKLLFILNEEEGELHADSKKCKNLSFIVMLLQHIDTKNRLNQLRN